MAGPSDRSELPNPSPGPTRRLSVGCLALGLVGGGTLVLLMGLAAVAIVWRAGHQSAIDAELARLRVEGKPITLDDLDASYRLDPDQPDATAAWQRVIKAFQLSRFDEDTSPLRISSDKRAIPDVSIPPDALEAFLQQYAGHFEIIDHAAEAGSNVRFPFDASELETKHNDHNQPLRNVHALLRYRHLAARRQSRVDEQIDTISIQLSVADIFGRIPQRIDELTSLAALGNAFSGTASTLGHEALTESQLDRLEAMWAATDPQSRLPRTIDLDRAETLHTYWHPDDPRIYLGEFYTTYLRTPLAIEHLRYHLDRFREIEQILAQKGTLSLLDRHPVSPPSLLGEELPLARDLSRTLNILITVILRSAGNRNLILAGIAVRRYHNRTGQWPEDWSDLADLLPDGVPVDPFSDQPLKMVRIDHPDGPPRTEIAKNDPNGPIGTGLLIYGVGVNRIDDGGVYDYGDGVNGGDHTLFLADEHKPAAYVPLPPPPADEFEPNPDGEDPEDADAADGASDGQAIGITPGIPADGPVPRSGPPSPEGRDILNVTRRTVLAWQRQAVEGNTESPTSACSARSSPEPP